MPMVNIHSKCHPGVCFERQWKFTDKPKITAQNEESSNVAPAKAKGSHCTLQNQSALDTQGQAMCSANDLFADRANKLIFRSSAIQSCKSRQSNFCLILKHTQIIVLTFCLEY